MSTWPTAVRSVDQLDLGIIDRLRVEPNISNTALASQFDVTNATIGARIQRLKTSGTARVVGATPLSSAGYGVVAWVHLRLDGQGLADVDELCRRLALLDGVTAIGGAIAEDQLGMTYATPNVDGLEQFVEHDLGALSGISAVSVQVVSQVYKERSDIGLRSPVETFAAGRYEVLRRTPLASMLTDLELRLLSELHVDGRLTKRELSRRLDIGEAMVRSRLNSLTKRNMIEYELVVHPRALGVRRVAGVEVDVDHRFMSNVIEVLKARADVSLILAMFGNEKRLLINVQASSAIALSEFLNTTLASIDGVRGYSARTYLPGFKHDPAWRLATASARQA